MFIRHRNVVNASSSEILGRLAVLSWVTWSPESCSINEGRGTRRGETAASNSIPPTLEPGPGEQWVRAGTGMELHLADKGGSES